MTKQTHPPHNEGLLNSVEAAIYLGLSPNTLARWRCEKLNISYCKIGGAVRYKKTELDSYITNQSIAIAKV